MQVSTAFFFQQLATNAIESIIYLQYRVGQNHGAVPWVDPQNSLRFTGCFTNPQLFTPRVSAV